MQSAQNLRSEAHLQVRRNDEGKTQRRRWIFSETIKLQKAGDKPKASFLRGLRL
jgi:hypothetical protein